MIANYFYAKSLKNIEEEIIGYERHINVKNVAVFQQLRTSTLYVDLSRIVAYVCIEILLISTECFIFCALNHLLKINNKKFEKD